MLHLYCAKCSLRWLYFSGYKLFLPLELYLFIRGHVWLFFCHLLQWRPGVSPQQGMGRWWKGSRPGRGWGNRMNLRCWNIVVRGACNRGEVIGEVGFWNGRSWAILEGIDFMVNFSMWDEWEKLGQKNLGNQSGFWWPHFWEVAALNVFLRFTFKDILMPFCTMVNFHLSQP